MVQLSYEFDVLSDMFAGGADPARIAEVRASAIRGALRWWFRVLGGFVSLKSRFPLLDDQERHVFGGLGHEEDSKPTASSVIVRVVRRDSRIRKGTDDYGAKPGTPKGYVLFPLRPQRDQPPDAAKRAVIPASNRQPVEVRVLLPRHPELKEDIDALMTVFGHWGSLGFRSRRGWGAIGFHGEVPSLALALERFTNPDAVAPHVLDKKTSADACVDALSVWLQGWRSHGRSPHLSKGPGFGYAKCDHDLGLRRPLSGTAYRPALGLPIIQRYTNAGIKHDWEAGTGRDKGRFASPVVLRPYRHSDGTWYPLVLFIDARRWPEGRKAYVDGNPVSVSTELYGKMKEDLASRELQFPWS